MRGGLLVLAAVVGGLVGALTLHLLGAGAREERRAASPNRTAPRDDSAADARWQEYEERLRLLEAARVPVTPAPSRVPGNPTSGMGAGETQPEQPGTNEADTTPPRKAISDFVAGLVKEPFDRRVYDQLFNRLIQHPEDIEATIAALAKEVAKDPENPEKHILLAKAYVAKLINTTTPGPQQGVVWGQAAKSYREALKRSPENWDAHFDLAFGTSQAPDFLGMRPQAIKQFESLLVLQESTPRQPHHVQTYFQLGTIYKNEGNAEKAREIWAKGLRLFPENKRIREALGVLEKR